LCHLPHHHHHHFWAECTGYFWNKVSLFAQASLDHDPPIYASHQSWHAPLCPVSSAQMESHTLFCLVWPKTMIFLVSVSHIARMAHS
jgi:hypothetical protein